MALFAATLVTNRSSKVRYPIPPSSPYLFVAFWKVVQGTRQ